MANLILQEKLKNNSYSSCQLAEMLVYSLFKTENLYLIF